MNDRDVFMFAIANHMAHYGAVYFRQRSHITDVVQFFVANHWKAVSPEPPQPQWIQDAERIAAAYFQGANRA